MTRPLRLAWSGRLGDHSAAANAAWTPLNTYVEVARSLAWAGFEFMVLEDAGGVRGGDPAAPGGSAEGFGGNRPDAGMLAPMLTSAVPDIGVAAMFAPTDYPPYLLARLVATLDHVTHGRIGWAIPRDADDVTPDVERWAEYLEVVIGLWETWDRDAMVEDAAVGVFAEPEKVHYLDHRGEHFRVRGPLNIVPGPQARPVIVQRWPAPSEDPRWLAHADVFVVEAATPEGVTAAATQLRSALAAADRSEESYSVLAAVDVRLDFGRPPTMDVAGRAELVVHGPAAEVADQLELVHDSADTDGFLVCGDWSPAAVAELGGRLVGTLRMRGLLPAFAPGRGRTFADAFVGVGAS